jgi:hypothetical protein
MSPEDEGRLLAHVEMLMATLRDELPKLVNREMCTHVQGDVGRRLGDLEVKVGQVTAALAAADVASRRQIVVALIGVPASLLVAVAAFVAVIVK